jgi:hypothetical protein
MSYFFFERLDFFLDAFKDLTFFFTKNIKECCLKPGGRCTEETLTYVDETGADRTISCYDEGVSKSVKKIAIELGYNDLDSKIDITIVLNESRSHFIDIKLVYKLLRRF